MSESPNILTSETDAAAELDTLRLLASRPDLSQRQLARALGLSLGKTHYVLHALLDKGLVKIENFSRSNNKLAYAYLLTPSGIAAKTRLTRDFLKVKIRQFETLRSEIDALRQEAESDGPAAPRVAASRSKARHPPSSTGAPSQAPTAQEDHR
jgi:EPS-associated MarR family transcriptional regulator